MPLIENEIIGDEVVQSDGQFHQNQIVPLVTGLSVVNLIQENIALYGDASWMTDLSTGKSITYSELAKLIILTCSAMQRRGLQAEDTVALMATNHLEVPILSFSIWRVGARWSGFDVGLFAAEVRNRIIESNIKFVVADELRARTVMEATEGLDVQLFVIGEAPGCTPVAQLFSEEMAELDTKKFNSYEGSIESEENFTFDMHLPAWLTYSSGTTGKPKGIIHTHFTLSPYLQPDKTRPDFIGQKFLFTNAMVHGSGLLSFLKSTANHQNAFTFSEINLENLIKGIDRVKPASISIFPHELAGICLYSDLSKYDLNSVESIVYCCSGILPSFERQIFEKMPKLKDLISMYGSSETMLITSYKQELTKSKERNEAIKSRIIGSSGKILPFVKLKIIDPESGEKLGVGMAGEIVVHTPFFMKGYFNGGELMLEDGWYKTGDQGYYDIEGNLFIIGRYKELIKYKSEKVAPSNIETVMMANPAVMDVAVVGLPHDIDGEHPFAFVVVKTDQIGQPLISVEELIDYTNERVVEIENLRGGIRFIDKIPRNKLGKILRRELIEKLLSDGI